MIRGNFKGNKNIRTKLGYIMKMATKFPNKLATAKFIGGNILRSKTQKSVAWDTAINHSAVKSIHFK